MPGGEGGKHFPVSKFHPLCHLSRGRYERISKQLMPCAASTVSAPVRRRRRRLGYPCFVDNHPPNSLITHGPTGPPISRRLPWKNRSSSVAHTRARKGTSRTFARRKQRTSGLLNYTRPDRCIRLLHTRPFLVHRSSPSHRNVQAH